ncbi:ketopantoate reductase family protein [Paraconexibacter algicola]|uniref:ketopantoate reductase family protein n=1 Tax=Paraconexibacter algicola TaxID=2133960 RepID=UPI001304D86E|nr:2-dehydropantoate 2-reductase [Paraconexibacter algicola]
MIAVLGPGGVGGLVAGALAHAGEPVVLLCREETADTLARTGLHVTSRALDEDFVAWPRIATTLDEPVDALLVASKATTLSASLERVAPDAPRLVVPLLNGLDHMEVLRARFGDARTRAGVIRVQSDRPAVGRIVQDSAAVRIDIAGPETDIPPVAALARALRSAGIETRTGASEADVLWSKLARLNAIACATTAFDATLGEIREDPSRLSALHAAIAETAAVARAEGADVDTDTTIAEVDALRGDQSSSMARDVAAARAPELDAIPGAVLRAAARHGIATPAVEYLHARIAARA